MKDAQQQQYNNSYFQNERSSNNNNNNSGDKSNNVGLSGQILPKLMYNHIIDCKLLCARAT